MAGAVLETLGPQANNPATLQSWRAHIDSLINMLGWPRLPITVRVHASGASLALAAPADQLFTATELNEFAWCTSVSDTEFHAPGHPAVNDPESARETLRRFSQSERQPKVIALLDAAREHDLPVLFDDDALSIGLGERGRTWPLTALPDPALVPWETLGRIPTVLVTGSNGKTTTVRLIAAMLRANGTHAGHSCTDGLFVDGKKIQSGDYSGPGGAREILRRDDVQSAVLETARGGLLRRGLALAEADVAVITNISADHFGEYGIHDLEGLAQVKFSVANAVSASGWLVLNAADPLLRENATRFTGRVAWFHLNADDSLLKEARHQGAVTCGVRHGRLWIEGPQGTQDFGAVDAMPLSVGGKAHYNVANLAGASLAAFLLGVPAQVIARTALSFGSTANDNAGRLQRSVVGGIQVFVDYAHNPEGLRGLLQIAASHRDEGRLALLLGQAGNRTDEQVRELAAAAAAFKPDLIVLKDLEDMLRGRAAGEVSGILRDELQRLGLPLEAMPAYLSELDAVHAALRWARAGDVLVLPIHGSRAQREVAALLDALQATQWVAGNALAPNSARNTDPGTQRAM